MNTVLFQAEQPYYELGNLIDPENIWIVCHGYAQNAESFIQSFHSLDLKKNLIIAPEGLSRFYRRGFAGEVVSSWMTRLHRETDIKNQIAYLDAIAEAHKDLIENSKKIVAFGFSQGAATVSRWKDQTEVKISDLILWGGIFPPDLSVDFFDVKSKGLKTKVYIGKEDPFFKEKSKPGWLVQLEALANVELVLYDGGHDIYPEPLRGALD